MEDKTPKVKIAERVIKSIRPWIEVVTAQSEWQSVDYLIKDAHVLFGCIDGYMQRMYLERAARRYCLPYIDIGMDVTQIGGDQYAIAGQMIMTLPDGPCLQCIGFLTKERLEREENDYGDAGINPQVVWANGILASLAVGEFVQLLTPWFKCDKKYVWLELDGNNQLIYKSKQPDYAIKQSCTHFTPNELGDPFFRFGED